MNNNKHAEKMARQQELAEQRKKCELLSVHFPKVESIVMSMNYTQSGFKLQRTFYFSPDSHAFFKVSCMSPHCIDGGFDLSEVVATMVGKRKVAGKGTLKCCGTDSSVSHSDIAYEITIRYR